MSASVLFRPNRKENNSSLNHSNKSLKFKSYRILRPAEPSNLMGFDDREIAEQITHEMVKIDEVIRGYKVEIGMNRVPKRRMRSIEEEMFGLEETIHNKDQQIAGINDQIKNLKIAKSKQMKASRQLIFSSETFILAEELKNQGFELRELIEVHSQRMISHKMLHKAIKEIEKVYLNMFPQRDINYETFREQNQEGKREEEEAKVKKREQLKIPSIREQIEMSVMPSVAVVRNEIDSKTMRELQDKKKKMDLAIRNAKKKHFSEVYDLTAKLQFLRDETSLLNETVREKETEKKNLETRFTSNQRVRPKYRGRGLEVASFGQHTYF